MASTRGRDRLGRLVPPDHPEARDHGVDVDAVRDASATVDVAQDLLDRGFLFAAHEVFETRWKNCPDDERDLWQGLAQWCVALTHAARGNDTGASTLRARARGHLMQPQSHAASDRLGLDIAAVTAWLGSPTDPVARVASMRS